MDCEDDKTRLKRKERRREKWVFLDRTKTRRDRNSMGLRGVHIGKPSNVGRRGRVNDTNIAEEAKERGCVLVLWTLFVRMRNEERRGRRWANGALGKQLLSLSLIVHRARLPVITTSESFDSSIRTVQTRLRRSSACMMNLTPVVLFLTVVVEFSLKQD